MEKIKTQEAILHIFEDSILRLAPAFYQAGESFAEYYQKATFSASHNNSHHPIYFSHHIETIPSFERLIEIKKNINEYTKEIVLKYTFQPFFYIMSVKIKFLNGHYSVLSDDKISNIVFEDPELREKKYTQQLSDLDIQDLVNIEINKRWRL